jgi:2,3-bisphosphoglycerate-independent phosphoglycerate mutase
MTPMNKKVILLILDGWGMTQDASVSAVAQAHTPFMDRVMEQYPTAQLLTHGMHVGLPDGQMGNSEVGHMNLGAGRVVYQDLAKINLAIQENTLNTYAKQNKKPIHFIGLVSEGGVHSHTNHLKALLDITAEHELEEVYIHAFTDGRDVDPRSGLGYIDDLLNHIADTPAKLASVVGRYFAMDRDKRWERIKKTYDLLRYGKGELTHDIIGSIKKSYENGTTDEFIKPLAVANGNDPITTIEKDDVVIFFNFRTDRGRQLTEALTQRDYPEFEMNTLPLHFVTLTNYDASFKDIHVVYDKENLTETLGAVLAAYGKTQIRIAETEKYPHVTFFFNGGSEEPFDGERRILCPSPKVATYDLQPEMSAFELRDRILPELQASTADFVCLNFANPDMVGHTGVFKAAIKACETVDLCASAIVEVALEQGYSTLIIADHGNSETMQNPDGSPNTAHTINPVPFVLVDPDITSINDGVLGDIAPTILDLMNIPKPEQMTGRSLLTSKS